VATLTARHMARAIGHIAAKRDAESQFPHKVDMRLLPDELDVRVRGMVAWCWQLAGPGGWEQHGHDASSRGDQAPSMDVVRFYFMDAGVAEAFRGRWEQRSGKLR
jgi:hypothetical protein